MPIVDYPFVIPVEYYSVPKPVVPVVVTNPDNGITIIVATKRPQIQNFNDFFENISSIGLDFLKSARKSYCTMLIVKGPIMKTKKNHAMMNEVAKPHPRYAKYNLVEVGASQTSFILKDTAVTMMVINKANQNTSHSAK